MHTDPKAIISGILPDYITAVIYIEGFTTTGTIIIMWTSTDCMLDISALSSANGCRYYRMLLRYVSMVCRVQCKVSSAVVTHLEKYVKITNCFLQCITQSGGASLAPSASA